MRGRVASWPLALRWGVYLAAIYVVLIFGVYGPGYDASALIYMRF